MDQHVENEPLLDRLVHAVEVERLELAVAAFPAEQLQRLRLRRRGERKSREVRQPAARLHLSEGDVLQLLFRGCGFALLRLGLRQ